MVKVEQAQEALIMSAHKSVDNLQKLSWRTPTRRAHVLKVEFNCNSVQRFNYKPIANLVASVLRCVCVGVWVDLWARLIGLLLYLVIQPVSVFIMLFLLIDLLNWFN